MDAHDGRSDHRAPPRTHHPEEDSQAHRWRPPIATPRGHASARAPQPLPDGGGGPAPTTNGSLPPSSSSSNSNNTAASSSTAGTMPRRTSVSLSQQPVATATTTGATTRSEPSAGTTSAGGGGPFRSPPAARAYNLMVAGARSSKTSLLRLLLDTSVIAPSATSAQRESVARFVQAGAGPTSHIRTATIDVEHERGPVALTLIDTPALDTADAEGSERLLVEISRHIDDRFAQSVEDERTAADHHVHLCLYFLDPDSIAPPSTPSSASLPSLRAGGGGGGLILEPPVPTHPAHTRATLPAGEINVIRRLSARVNVLPVVARADTLTNERLAAVKLAVRRDLADAGIGFGIFDTDTYPVPIAQGPDAAAESAAAPPAAPGSPPSAGPTGNAGPTGPGHLHPPPALQLPYALIAPESYAHSDGVGVGPPSRHELVRQYSPAGSRGPLRGRFVRNFRWGVVDVLDPRHCDFAALRGAIFQHMEVLLNYTRDYLYERFKAEVLPPQPVRSRANSSAHGHPYSGPPSSSATLSPQQHRAHPHHLDTNQGHFGGPPHGAPPVGTDRDGLLASDYDHRRRLSNATDSGRQRSKKITVACNFCRSRKLKCDGGRPACTQCVRRSVACDYIPHVKRRGPGKYKVLGGGDNSDEGGDDEDDSSPDQRDESPVASNNRWEQPPRGPRDDERAHYARSPEGVRFQPHQPQQAPQQVPPPPQARPPPSSQYGPPGLAPPPPRHDMGDAAHNAGRARASTLSGTSTREAGMAGAYDSRGPPPVGAPHSLPPMRAMSTPPEEPSLAGSKRRLSQSFSKARTSTSGSKVVACNFCRARKTKCDSIHPTCSSCARRQLPCSYVNEPGVRGAGVRRLSSASMSGNGAPNVPGPDPHSTNSSKSSSNSPPPASQNQAPGPRLAPMNGGPPPAHHYQQPPPPPQHREQPHAHHHRRQYEDDEMDEDAPPQAKKLRVDNGYDGPPPVSMHATVAPLQ